MEAYITAQTTPRRYFLYCHSGLLSQILMTWVTNGFRIIENPLVHRKMVGKGQGDENSKSERGERRGDEKGAKGGRRKGSTFQPCLCQWVTVITDKSLSSAFVYLRRPMRSRRPGLYVAPWISLPVKLQYTWLANKRHSPLERPAPATVTKVAAVATHMHYAQLHNDAFCETGTCWVCVCLSTAARTTGSTIISNYRHHCGLVLVSVPVLAW